MQLFFWGPSPLFQGQTTCSGKLSLQWRVNTAKQQRIKNLKQTCLAPINVLYNFEGFIISLQSRETFTPIATLERVGNHKFQAEHSLKDFTS